MICKGIGGVTFQKYIGQYANLPITAITVGPQNSSFVIRR
jgi:hypothetical protein